MTTHTNPLRTDFRNFLYVVWKHLGLPEPTPAQYEIAARLQNGPSDYDPKIGRTDMIRAFRGIGKSYITAAYCLWRLYCDPVNEKILVVSASGAKAKEFVGQCKLIMETMDLLAHLRPTDEQRNSFDRFDVRQASLAQQPSLKAIGVTGQLPGNRATLIVPDDIESPENSKTEAARSDLLRKITEFEAIKVPYDVTSGRPAGDVVFLGTPQTLESMYNRLVREQGYSCFTIPSRVPAPDKLGNYLLRYDETGTDINILAPFVQDMMKVEGSEGKPIDPLRFSDEDLIGREAKGRSWFQLQYMLDTTLSDAQLYPLKQHDLTVMALNHLKAPLVVQWGKDGNGYNIRNDIPNVGFTGDYLMGPLFIDNDLKPYEASVLFVDPAGRGKDETAWAVVKVLAGQFFVTKVGGFSGDVNEGMIRIAQAARDQSVNAIMVEPNFAGTIWIAAFQPVLAKVWPGTKGEPGGCRVEEAKWARTQKELRIIDTLEPVMNGHRLIVDEQVARDDVLMYQLTHITRDRGSLVHDDRLDALAGAVSELVRHLEQDTLSAARDYKAQELDAMLEDFIEGCQNPTRRKSRRGSQDQFEVYGPY